MSALAFVPLALALAAGLLLVRRLAPAHPPLERLALTACASVAALVVASYLAAFAGALLAAVALLAVAVAALAWEGRRAPWPSWRLEGAPVELGVAAAALALTTAWFALPVLRRSFPMGWDPAFHASVIASIRDLGRVPPTWGPYEPGEIFNYPSGLHASLAVLARLGGFAPEKLVSAGLVACAALSLLVALALGHRFGGSPRAGAFATLVYGLTAGWGTPASHADWGGLPNLAGLALMGGCYLALAVPGRGAALLAAVFAVAVAFLHHLSFALLAASLALVLALELVTERRLSSVGRGGLVAMAIAGVCTAVFVLARREGRFSPAQAFQFDREGMLNLQRVAEVMGTPMLVLGLAGLVFAIATLRTPAARLLPAWAVGLMGFWALFDLVYRALANWLVHHNYTAMTPGRGLTDAALPLAVCAGLLLARLSERLLALPWAGVVAVAAVLAALDYRAEAARAQPNPGREAAFARTARMCALVQEKTPPDAVLFAPNAGEPGIWIPYLCQRETNYFPDPGFYTSPYREAKMRTNDPREFARIVNAARPRPVFYATPSGFDGERVAATDGWNLYRVTP